jgi:hypothetical protein
MILVRACLRRESQLFNPWYVFRCFEPGEGWVQCQQCHLHRLVYEHVALRYETIFTKQRGVRCNKIINSH